MPTLRELRRLTADKVAPYELVIAGVRQGAGYAGTSSNGSKRRVASSDLVSLDQPGLNYEAPPDAHKGDWVVVCSDPIEQGRVPENGYGGYGRVDELLTGYNPSLVSGADPCGYIDVERPYSAFVPAGTEVEIHALPALRGGRAAGYHAAINHALRVILRQDAVLVPGVTGQTILDVTASFPWLNTPQLFIGAQYVQTQAGVDTYLIEGARLRFDGEKVLVSPNTQVSSGQQLPIQVMRPLFTWIAPQPVAPAVPVYAESSVGLVKDGDRCLGDGDAIALVAAFHVADGEARLCTVGSAEQKYWLAQAHEYATRSPFLKDQRVRQIPTQPAVWPDNISPWGPYGGRWGPGFR